MCLGSWWRGQTCRGGGPRGRSGGWSQPRGGRTRWARAGWRWRGWPGEHIYWLKWKVCIVLNDILPREGNQMKYFCVYWIECRYCGPASIPMGFYFNHQWKRKLMMENDQPKLHTWMWSPSLREQEQFCNGYIECFVILESHYHHSYRIDQ